MNINMHKFIGITPGLSTNEVVAGFHTRLYIDGFDVTLWGFPEESQLLESLDLNADMVPLRKNSELDSNMENTLLKVIKTAIEEFGLENFKKMLNVPIK